MEKAYILELNSASMYRFPPELLRRLRRAAPRLTLRLHKMTPLDERVREFEKLKVTCLGNQVWGINLSRHTSRKFVLKKVHPTHHGKNFTAQQTIEDIRMRVERYKSMNGRVMRQLHFELRTIPAEPISEELIIMPLFRGVSLAALAARREDIREGEPSRVTSRFDKDFTTVLAIGSHLLNSIPTDNLNDLFYIGKNAQGKHIFFLTNDILSREN